MAPSIEELISWRTNDKAAEYAAQCAGSDGLAWPAGFWAWTTSPTAFLVTSTHSVILKGTQPLCWCAFIIYAISVLTHLSSCNVAIAQIACFIGGAAFTYYLSENSVI